MYNLKDFLVAIWVNVKIHFGKFATWISNYSDAKLEHESIAKAKECLFRAKNAYLALTGSRFNNLISAYTIDQIMRTCRNSDEIIQELEKTSARDDRLFCFLLIIAIGEVYRPKTPPTITGSFIPRLK